MKPEYQPYGAKRLKKIYLLLYLGSCIAPRAFMYTRDSNMTSILSQYSELLFLWNGYINLLWLFDSEAEDRYG